MAEYILRGDPDEHGGPGVTLPVMVIDEDDMQVFVNPKAAWTHRHILASGQVLKASGPLVFPSLTEATTASNRIAMKVEAVEVVATRQGQKVTAVTEVEGRIAVKLPGRTTGGS